MDGKISEQRVYCKTRAQLGFLPTEIHADLQKVYGNCFLKYATVCKWVCRFNDGRESIENDPWVGRPVSILTEKNVATVKTLIEEDAHHTMQEIEELSGIHSSSVVKILRERLVLQKVCVRWVRHLLTDKQKQSQLRLASHVIEKYDKCDPHHLEEIVTGDETWIYHFQPDSRAKNKVWPVIARRCKTSNRMLYAIFFDSKVQSFKFQSRKAYMPYVPDCPGQSRILILCPGVLENMKFLRPDECEGFVINSCLNNKCCICCRVQIISGIPVVIDRH